MTAPTTSPEAQAFLAAVEQELIDLPADDRRELLDDLALHLVERDGDASSAPLGSPQEYARELRDAAGLPARAAVGRRRFRAAVDRLVAARAVAEVRGFMPLLRPAWWVLRGYLVVAVVALQDVNGTRDFPVPALWGSHVLGVGGVLAAATASVVLGRCRLPRSAAALVVAANLTLLVIAGNLMSDARWRLVRVEVRDVASSSPFTDSPLVSEHGPVTNVFPYDASGRPLDGVLLYDQDGRPLLVGTQKWWSDYCRRLVAFPTGADGLPVRHSFPQRYVLDPSGTTLSGVVPVSAGQCTTTATARPTVVLPGASK
ncbi:MAG TPA: hypothetical protein VM097_08860 [Mycobacteriales bacterium]|nr:hypothetical protein [Mycobacteriales bacterium]